MGYACPVCEDPQADAGHLANHLAFTAITSGGAHEDWLDEHVPDWGQLGETELAEAVVDHADDAEYPQVFEESGVDSGHEHHGHDHGVDPSAARTRGQGELDDEAKAIMEEARQMTEEMRQDDEDDASGDGDDQDDSSPE